MDIFLRVIDLIAFGGAAIYAVAGIATGIGILIGKRPAKLTSFPSVSVLVSARNEARDLPRCISALAALDYPRERLEILLVDDRSTDATAQIIANACSRYPYMRALSTKDLNSKLEGKSRGIAHAAASAKHEWLFITDADGAVHPQWLQAMLGAVDEKTALLSGPYFPQSKGFVGACERATALPALGISYGAAGLGAEVIPMGPNMAILREVYIKYGGLEAVPFRIAEDVALWELGKRAGMVARAMVTAETTVIVTNVPSFASLISQQRRWLGGGVTDGPITIQRIAALVGLYACVTTLCVYATLFVNHSWLPLALILTSQVATLSAWRLRLGMRSVLRFIPLSLVYTTLLFIWLPLSVAFIGRNSWRGEGYAISFSR